MIYQSKHKYSYAKKDGGDTNKELLALSKEIIEEALEVVKNGKKFKDKIKRQ